MKSFTLVLHDATHSEEIQGVTSFVGEDESGSFGMMHGHARLMTTLIVGLARFYTDDDIWHYLALPSGVLYFSENVLTISTRHYMLDTDYTRISDLLRKELLAEEEKLYLVKESLRHMEEEVFRRLWEMGRKGAG